MSQARQVNQAGKVICLKIDWVQTVSWVKLSVIAALLLNSCLLPNQGDQIGRIFAHWAIFFGQFLIGITGGVRIFGQLFSPRKKLCARFDKKPAWTTFWAIFFTKSSGHPAPNFECLKAPSIEDKVKA
jgi:hypothetical protein